MDGRRIGRNEHETATVDRQMMWALELLQRLKTGGFYGRVILSFEQGAVRHAETQESLKPPPR
ncbi:hypothetical protein C41B8_05428 [Salinisphaera hydrothermalis C41B8]|uniref:Uncharacterized protein n=1 Tax=Salinisphaera hydrothermalis (strain C41B8) TaxID=1304275 RepID=A0A084INN3_SALHC|nr:hypothetical protein C41B8_05428 [Salinisphaera hydrothermalis C41B8]